MRPAAAVQLLLILVTMQAGNSLPIIQVKHLFHVFLQTQHHYESKDLALGKHYAAPLLKWCPGICLVSSRRGEGCVSLKKKKKQENLMHSFSRAVVTHLPFECHALSWLKLKTQIGAALSKHFSGIFFISSYHYVHNPFFTLTPVMISFIQEGGEGIYLN